MRRRTFVQAVALGAIVAASRVPFTADTLWAWDSVLYARALEQGFHVDFELGGQRPQPPGYILYIAFAWLARSFVADTNAALVLVAVLASGIAAAAVFALARRSVPAGPALVATAAFACDPLVWLYGEVAYPYIVLGACSVVLASLFWHARELGTRWSLFASAAFGVGSGFRQDLLLLLAPLWIWMVWPAAWRTRIASAACVAAGIAVWLAPTAALSGGLESYLRALAQQADAVRTSYSIQGQGFQALWFNLRLTADALSWGAAGCGALLLLAVTPRHAVALARGRRPLLGTPGLFFVTWVLPAVLFYITVHIGEAGYVLSVLPGLYVLGAVALARVAASLGRTPRVAWYTVAASVALAPAIVFLGSTERYSAHSVARHGEALSARVAFVRETFPRERTVVLAREDFLLVRHYLPEYRAWRYDPDPHGAAAKRRKAMSQTTFVIFTDGLSPRQSLAVREVEVAPGVHLAYFTAEAGEIIELYGERYMVREPQ